MNERLIPVRSESELRVGMLLVVLGCECGVRHRILLTGLDTHNKSPCRGQYECDQPGRSWVMADAVHGLPRSGVHFCGYRDRLYRVDTGLDASEENPYTIKAPKPARVSR